MATDFWYDDWPHQMHVGAIFKLGLCSKIFKRRHALIFLLTANQSFCSHSSCDFFFGERSQLAVCQYVSPVILIFINLLRSLLLVLDNLEMEPLKHVVLTLHYSLKLFLLVVNAGGDTSWVCRWCYLLPYSCTWRVCERSLNFVLILPGRSFSASRIYVDFGRKFPDRIVKFWLKFKLWTSALFTLV